MPESFIRLFAVLAVWWLLVACAFALVPIDGHERSFIEAAGGALFVGFVSVGAFLVGALVYLPAIRLLAGNPQGRRWRLVAVGLSPIVGAVWLFSHTLQRSACSAWMPGSSPSCPASPSVRYSRDRGPTRPTPLRFSVCCSSALRRSYCCLRSSAEKSGRGSLPSCLRRPVASPSHAVAFSDAGDPQPRLCARRGQDVKGRAAHECRLRLGTLSGRTPIPRDLLARAEDVLTHDQATGLRSV